MPPKRKASEQPSGAYTDVKKPRVTTIGAISSLVPVGERKMAKKGVSEPELLRMLCEDRDKNNERKELHFKKIIHSEIDWDNKLHIDKINAWRNQIYGRAGIKNKTVLMWHKDEEAWLELYWQLLVVEANKRGIEMPKPKTIRENFNVFFNGKVFHSAGAGELEPRVDRGSGPFTSKMGRLIKSLRPYLEEKLRGKKGSTFVPKINQEMLEEYQKLKADLTELGCDDNKIVPWEELEDEANDKDYVTRCREYIESLPDQDDVNMDDEEEAEDATLVASEELDRELLELASEPAAAKTEPMDTDEEPSSFKVAADRKPSWVTLATGSDSSSREASPPNIVRNKCVSTEDVVSPRKKRADSVASTDAAAEEDSTETTLVGKGVISDEVKDHFVIGSEDRVVQEKAGSAAENEEHQGIKTMSDTDSDTASSVGEILEDVSEADTTTFKCLFCDEQWGRVPDMFVHCNKEHGFDVESTITKLGQDIDELTIIKLVNYLRLESQKSIEPKNIKVDTETLADDKYLQPTLLDDALLFELGDFMPDPDSKAVDYDEYEAALQKNIGENVEKISLDNDRDTDYFESYKGNAIHREMIEDRVRTEGYRDFIEKNAELFKGKTVLDVGCGTGILSLFCARVGAKRVLAVDNSDIANRARENIARNGYQDKIEVIQGRVEDFHMQRKIGKEKVDIIISEWMGYGLLFEGMLDSVLRARDLYLKEDGLMVPSHCTMRIAPISDKEWIADASGEKFWKDVYGFDFTSMIPGGILNEREIGVFDVPSKSISGEPSTFYQLDLKNIQIRDLDFTAPFSSKLCSDSASIDAFAIWFDTFFLPSEKSQDATAIDVAQWGDHGEAGLGFSTGPYSIYTHWHQAVLLLSDKDRKKEVNGGSILKGKVTYKKPRKDDRGIDVTVEWEAESTQGPVAGHIKRSMGA
ncbi:Ribosomal protein arginine N-methyltransferase rmt3 [Didymosphaeria variabile]|uniref:type I protein arginine methyltransferase n=1 Tax=Didymosphaeria variabile TaxID=1932322 RepID=A0A9W8XVV6_9PLEO|nr:Ribosomal protein arginine N-methyltransferase rmt3 [Didymosphaeria variabile]KAJ4360669.1 Ribosomal protein arginine N-methyltransferase rmt3 [Didymosphaeria variabile]